MIVLLRAKWQGAFRARFSNFPKGSGVAEESIPIVVAEEANGIPGDIIGDVAKNADDDALW